MTVSRNYLFKNAQAYDIYQTIVALTARAPTANVTDAIQRLIDMQWTGRDEDFLFDLDSEPDNYGTWPLVYLDIWLAAYGVAVDLNDVASLDSDLLHADVLTVDLPDGDSDDLSWDADDITEEDMEAAAIMAGIENPNNIVTHSYVRMARGMPTYIEVADPEEEMQEE